MLQIVFFIKLAPKSLDLIKIFVVLAQKCENLVQISRKKDVAALWLFECELVAWQWMFFYRTLLCVPSFSSKEFEWNSDEKPRKMKLRSMRHVLCVAWFYHLRIICFIWSMFYLIWTTFFVVPSFTWSQFLQFTSIPNTHLTSGTAHSFSKQPPVLHKFHISFASQFVHVWLANYIRVTNKY